MLAGLIAASQLLAWRHDASFCPLDPAPIAHDTTIGAVVPRKVSASQTRDPDLIKRAVPISAQLAGRLVDTRLKGAAAQVGWIFLDESGGRYILLKRSAPRDVYDAFGRGHTRNPIFESLPRPVASGPWPSFVRTASCTQAD